MIPDYKGEKIPYDNPQAKQSMEMSVQAFENNNKMMVQYMCKNIDKQKVIIDMMSHVDRKTYVNGYIDMLNLDLRTEISKIKIPVTILAATSPSLDIVSKTYQDQYKNLPSVKVFYAENAAHFVMYDQPEWFIKHLTGIIQ